MAQRAGETAPLERASINLPTPSPMRGEAGLPQPLAQADAERLRRIFALQAQGAFPQAQQEAERLADRRLLGHVLADRWRQPGAPEPSLPELYAWLADYADHPDAAWVHALLRRHLPRNAPHPPAPPDAFLAPDADAVPEETPPPGRDYSRDARLDRAVQARLADGDAEAALAAIGRGATGAYAAQLRAEVALALFHRGRDEEAYRIATAAAQAEPGQAYPAYVAGLAAWGMGQAELALARFEAAARADTATPALRAGAAFWTARSAIRTRRPQLYVPWMLQAAQEPRTFYGLIARRILGLAPGFAWEREAEAGSEGAALAETASGWRALALLQIGQRDRAEAELRRLWPVAQGNPALSAAMLAVARDAGLTDLAAQVAALAQTSDGRPRDYDRFPLPRLQPLGGFRVDPALLYGLALQESRFDPRAVSAAGARGLMQIMPATAAYIVKETGLPGAARARLHDPAFSLELAQRYLALLTTREVVDGDLIRMLAAYNNGPGNVGRWAPNVRHQDDPFLFVESIPVNETRAFVQRVLAYSWIYASRLGLPAPSLDALAAGQFPRFDTTPMEVAEQPPPRGTGR
ncbi:lytic transglycosylase domain-containing protein [Roseomonas sp. GC11]|uniref:lytic transglycosylase domain-containing protein n=1 Tax=Roseomonas sp. GC11 TaxID=2950546 RepID=UPI00210B3AC6|nr:lytic transglycosylase domain-containing protein [Roseomonas sp. GC11]MCQ4160688.1 lytic transglycosylase domain-containing protein [Roseomonas sp. GC11]